MLLALVFGSYFIGIFLVLGQTISRVRSLNGAQTQRLAGAAAALGGQGAITKDGGSITLNGPDRFFELTGCDYGKRQPGTFHLGTEIRAGVLPAPAAGSAFRRTPGDERTLARLPHVVFRSEGAISALTKLLRLNVELRTGDDRFDDAVYIEHDGERATVAQMLADPDLRAALLSAIEAGATVVLNEEGHGVALRWMGGTEPNDAVALNAAGQMLGRIADRLPPVADGRRRPRRSHFAYTFGNVAPIVAAAPVLALGMITHTKLGPLDRAFGVSALVGTGIALALALALGWVLARGRTAPLRKLYFALTLGVATVPALTGSALAFANGAGVEARESRPTKVETTRSSKGKKGRVTCYVRVAPWRADLGEVESKIDCGRTSTIDPGDPATARVGVGRFGWEWLEGIDVPEQKRPRR